MRLLLSLALLLTATIPLHRAEAASPTGTYVRQLFEKTSLSDVAYTEIVTTTARQIAGIMVFSTANNPIALAVGAAGSEVEHLVVQQGTLPGNPGAGYAGAPVGSYAGTSQFFPLQVQGGRRISMRALNSPVTNGEIQINFVYGSPN